MLTILQKARILIKAGVQIPAFPEQTAELDGQQRQRLFHLAEDKTLPAPQPDADSEDWNKAIEALHVQFVAVRAARSLRLAHDADVLHQLRTGDFRK